MLGQEYTCGATRLDADQRPLLHTVICRFFDYGATGSGFPTCVRSGRPPKSIQPCISCRASTGPPLSLRKGTRLTYPSSSVCKDIFAWSAPAVKENVSVCNCFQKSIYIQLRFPAGKKDIQRCPFMQIR